MSEFEQGAIFGFCMIAHEDFMLHMPPWRRRLDAVVGLSRTSYVGRPYGAPLLFARRNGKGAANGR